MKKILSAVVACLVGAALLAPSSALAAGKCAKDSHPGGDWRSFGYDLQNSRWQDAKQVPTPDDLLTRLPKWTLSIADAGATGNFQSTPVVADGCLYVGTNQGWIIAANADTGEVVWAENVPSSDLLAGLSGGVFSLTVDSGKVFALVSANEAPTAVALDQYTGKVLWKNTVSKEKGAYTNASPVVIGDLLFMGLSGPEDVEKAPHPGGYAILDKDTGELITREYTINQKDQSRGQFGASLWGTGVYDPKTGFIYDGTGQPANKAREHSHSNAIVKINLNKGPGFAEIVDSYHGDFDDRQDVDFGASPTLLRNKRGDALIAVLQKSGKLHAVYADTMEQAWWVRLSDPLALGNTSTGATDGNSFYVAGNTQSGPPTNDFLFGGSAEEKLPNPGYLYSINVNNGAVNWKTPIAGGVEYHLISGAGDVVYVVTTHGLLLGLNKADGLPVFVRSLSADTQDGCVNLSSGAIVARNTVYAVCDVGGAGSGWIVAY
jgi:outer membrane protein assembly factor BamB